MCIDYAKHGARHRKLGPYWCHNKNGNQVQSGISVDVGLFDIVHEGISMRVERGLI